MINIAKAFKLNWIYFLTASDRDNLFIFWPKTTSNSKKEKKKKEHKITYPIMPCTTAYFPKSLKITYTCMIFKENARNTVSEGLY